MTLVQHVLQHWVCCILSGESKATEILENSTKLCISNATRWNSQLKMLRSILRIPANVMDQLDFPDKLSAYELKLIQELCDILLPFEEATDAVQGDNIVTASMVIVCVQGLRHQLENLQERYNSRLITRLGQNPKCAVYN